MDIRAQEETFMRIAAWVQEQPVPTSNIPGDLERGGVQFFHTDDSPSGGFSFIKAPEVTVYLRPKRTGIGLGERLDYRERSCPEDLMALASRLKLAEVKI